VATTTGRSLDPDQKRFEQTRVELAGPFDEDRATGQPRAPDSAASGGEAQVNPRHPETRRRPAPATPRRQT